MNETGMKVTTVGYCHEDHCEGREFGDCPHFDEQEESTVILIQSVFAQYGPTDERLCDWRRCVEEPWKSLADALEVGL